MAIKVVDEEMTKEYVENNGEYCLYCKSDQVSDIDDTRDGFHDDTYYRTKGCGACGETWSEEYTLTGVLV